MQTTLNRILNAELHSELSLPEFFQDYGRVLRLPTVAITHLCFECAGELLKDNSFKDYTRKAAFSCMAVAKRLPKVPHLPAFTCFSLHLAAKEKSL